MTDKAEQIDALGQTESNTRLQSQFELLRKLTVELGAAPRPRNLVGRVVFRLLPRFARPAPAAEAERTAEELRRLAQALIMSSSR